MREKMEKEWRLAGNVKEEQGKSPKEAERQGLWVESVSIKRRTGREPGRQIQWDRSGDGCVATI